jgi:hypothetical protein
VGFDRGLGTFQGLDFIFGFLRNLTKNKSLKWFQCFQNKSENLNSDDHLNLLKKDLTNEQIIVDIVAYTWRKHALPGHRTHKIIRYGFRTGRRQKVRVF